MNDRIIKLSVILTNFVSLEMRLCECLDFLPYINENKNVASPKFVPIILDACSLIDSILRNFVGIENNRSNLKKLIEETDNSFELENTISMFLVPDYMFLNPFALSKKHMPLWWNAYNLIKHDRINNYSKATYENTVLSICALHQVIVRNYDFISNMISAGWFNNESTDMVEVISAQHVGSQVKPIAVIPVESKLFVTPLQLNFVQNDSNHFYIDNNCDFSLKVKAMISALECIDAQ